MAIRWRHPFVVIGIFSALLAAPETGQTDPIPSRVPSQQSPSEPPVQPGPLEFFGFPSPPASPAPDLNARAAGLFWSPNGKPDLTPLLAPYPIPLNARVQFFLDLYQSPGNREAVAVALKRSGRYMGMIRRVLREEGLPEELAFMPVVESGFNPVATSRAGAKGLWQFMRGTARHQGLRVDRWVDERLDPERSTVAAARHLKRLYLKFGSWSLAQAAYNAGERRVARALRRSSGDDFWSLIRGRGLRSETKRFVPAVLAVTLIGLEPERYGFSSNFDPPLAYERVTAPPALRLRVLAREARISRKELIRLNRALRRGVTPPGGSYSLKVPEGSAGKVRAVLAELGDTTVHVVKPRETLSEIALDHGVTVAELVRWNGIRNRSLIHPGDRVLVAPR
ncbi:MAG: transglycosylase SLT domain-containing protein [Candidatus Methylomirabilia bacterium]